MHRILALLAILGFAAPAFAESELAKTLTPTDLGRLAQFQTARANAIEEARKDGDAADVEVLDAIRGLDIRGSYRCAPPSLAARSRSSSTIGSAARSAKTTSAIGSRRSRVPSASPGTSSTTATPV